MGRAGDRDPVIGALPPGQPRAALVTEVRRACAAHLSRRARVLVALSGGPDSTALAYLVEEARPDLRLHLVHVRHGLRDDAGDARVAAYHAGLLGLPYHEEQVEVVGAGRGLEAAAREARYGALTTVARRLRSTAVLVGHSADDRAETVLLNLGRGCGVRGAAGMPDVRLLAPGVRLVRPLLRLRRADLHAFVAGEGLVAADDPMNRDGVRRRTRIRDAVLPALASISGGAGDPVALLCRFADLAREDAEALDALAARHARRMARRWGPVLVLPRRELAGLPPAIAGRIVRAALTEVTEGDHGPVADAVRGTLALEPGGRLDVAGGGQVSASRAWLALAPARLPALDPRLIVVPGATELGEIGALLRTDWVDQQAGQRFLPLPLPPASPPPPRPWLLPAGATGPGWAALPVTKGLFLRSREPGDRIALPAGTRKIQDVLVDAGVPRLLRDLVPVVTDRDGTPLWLPGLALARRRGTPAARIWMSPGALGSAPARAVGL